jgi:hypothetical protein
MGWLASLFTAGFFKGLFGFGTKALDVYMAKANGNVQEAIALMAADQVRLNAQRDVTLAAMNHPIFWLGWIFFVLPTGFYYAKSLVWDKAFHLGITDPITDPLITQWSTMIVLSIFGLQVGTGLVGSLLNKLIK